MERCASARRRRVALLLACVRPRHSVRLLLVLLAVVFGGAGTAHAIVFTAETSAHNTVSNNLTVAVPATTTPGNLFLANVAVIGSPTVTAPGGWTLIRKDTNAASTHMSQYIYWHAVGNSEPATYTWTFSTKDGADGGIADYAGVDTTNPVFASSGQSALKSSQIVGPSVTATAAGDTLVASFGYADIGTIGAPPGMAQRYSDSANNLAGQRTTIELADQTLNTPGATGNRVASINQLVNWVGQLVGLNPDLTAPTTPGQVTQTASTASSVTLGWQASSDNVAVAGYGFSQGTTLLANPTGTSYTVSNLTCGTTYNFSVAAYDQAGNYSSPAAVSATTAGCTAPTVTLTAPSGGSTVSGTGVTLTASAAAGSPQARSRACSSGWTASKSGPPSRARRTRWRGIRRPCRTARTRSPPSPPTKRHSTTSAAITVSVSNAVALSPPTVSLLTPGDNTIVGGSSVALTANAAANPRPGSPRFSSSSTAPTSATPSLRRRTHSRGTAPQSPTVATR